jgi:adenylate cyclase
MTGLASDIPSGIILVVATHPTPWPDVLGALSQQGYTIQLIQQFTDILAASRVYQPDVVLAEAQPDPAQNAYLCEQIQLDIYTRFIPVFFIGSGPPHQRLQILQLGAIDYLVEPLWLAEVIVRITTQAQRYRHQRSLTLHLQRAVTAGAPTQLLQDLQQVLRRQTYMLQEHNEQLQREVHEREEAEQALRQEQQKSEQLLLNILPQAIVDKLKRLEGSLAERFEEVTILFADIVNFTPLAAQISPLELVNWLNYIFSQFDRLAAQLRLEKIKTIGDAYMVVGGLPLPQADHAIAVMEMAIAMQEAAQGFVRHDGQRFQLRIGINTGPVVAGVIGIRKFSYDLWGDAVNIASRMEAQGTPDKIQVTEATYRHLSDRYQFERIGQVLVKGRGYLTTYQYVGRR